MRLRWGERRLGWTSSLRIRRLSIGARGGRNHKPRSDRLHNARRDTHSFHTLSRYTETPSPQYRGETRSLWTLSSVTYDFRIAVRVPKDVKDLRARLLAGKVPDKELEYLRAGMRSLENHLGGYKGASPAEVEAIAQGKRPTMNSSQPFEPVRFDLEPGLVVLSDGRHRLQAAKAAGARHVLATLVYPNGQRETAVIPIPQ